MRKSPDAPRRLYTRKSAPVVCFAGSLFAPPKGESSMNTDVEVTCFEVEGDSRHITVKQRKPHAKGVTETWRKVNS